MSICNVSNTALLPCEYKFGTLHLYYDCLALTVVSPLQGQRTVYRLTLVKSFNTEELNEYARLVSLGDPDFIEVKVSLF